LSTGEDFFLGGGETIMGHRPGDDDVRSDKGRCDVTRLRITARTDQHQQQPAAATIAASPSLTTPHYVYVISQSTIA